jgi:GNAT superfamily N-acetyltransferase
MATEEDDLNPAFPMLPVAITLTRCDTGESVKAELVELTSKLAKLKIGSKWWTNLDVSRTQRQMEGDHHWDWAAEIGKYRNSLFVESVAVQTDDGELQGAMIYRLDAQSLLSSGVGAVLIDRLATAPRNRGWLVETPLYRGVGKNLVSWAAYHSNTLGFSGRVVLATLPSLRTIGFYESLGFQRAEVEKDDMIILELEPKTAAVLLSAWNNTR